MDLENSNNRLTEIRKILKERRKQKSMKKEMEENVSTPVLKPLDNIDVDEKNNEKKQNPPPKNPVAS